MHSGHGVLISHNNCPLILTARHVAFASYGPKIYVKFRDDEGKFTTCVAKVVHSDIRRDLALLQIKEFVNGYVNVSHLRETELCTCEEVYMSSSMDCQGFSFTVGNVWCATRKHGDIEELFRDGTRHISLETLITQCQHLHGIEGCSGSPVFDGQGYIIGIYSFGYGRMDNLIHVKEIQKFLEAYDGLSLI